ncbi:MAG TPA: class I SAM-dependent methyltransferase [bacterium]|nr:class I SAM-dependent methyltransferase [bacterium]
MPIAEDATAIKEREHKSWTFVAPGWRKHDARLVEITTPVTERMLELARIKGGQHILDLACGTGEPALAAAGRIDGGRVVALDFVEEMLDFAREKAAARRLTNIEFQRTDAEALRFANDSFDAVTMRFGLMFLPDPLACAQKAYRVLKPGGRFVAACWADPKDNRWASMPMRIIRRELNLETPPPGSPGLFAFADRSRFESVLHEAGFHHVSVEPITLRMADFDTPAEYFTFTRELAGPIAILFSQLPPDRQAAVRDEIEREAAGPDGRVRIDGITWVAHGEK